MTAALSPADMAWAVMVPNLAYLAMACLSIPATLALGWQVIDWLTPFDIGSELRDRNLAVAMLLSSMAAGLCLAVGMGVSAAMGG